MLNDSQLINLVKSARELSTKRKFTQSVELTMVLKDIDVKKGFALNEVVPLPNKPGRQASICIIASGDMGTRARKAEVDKVIEPEELNRLGTNKREARKIVRAYDFFLADTSLMSSVGRSLGQFLGPKGKMPTPFPYGAPIETIAERTKSILTTLRNRRARGEQVAMTQIVAEEQLRLREKLMRKPKPTTTNDEKRTKFLFFHY